jgi:hypothetical protein
MAVNDPANATVIPVRERKTMGTNQTPPSTRDQPIVLMPLDEPLVIDAIRCRLRQDIDEFGLQHSIPADELRLMLRIIDAARACVREWKPNGIEKARGAGTGVGMRAAEDSLIREVTADI